MDLLGKKEKMDLSKKEKEEEEYRKKEKVEKNLEKIKEKLVKYSNIVRFNNSCVMQVTGGDLQFSYVYETNFCTTCSGKNDYMYKCHSCRIVFFWDCAHLSHICENINSDVVRIPFYKN